MTSERMSAQMSAVSRQTPLHPENDAMAECIKCNELPMHVDSKTPSRRIEAQGGFIPEKLGGGTALEPVFVEWKERD